MKLTLDLPESVFSSLRRDPGSFADELRLAASVKWYEMGRISQEKASELAGLSRIAFIDALRLYAAPAVQAEASELAGELDA